MYFHIYINLLPNIHKIKKITIKVRSICLNHSKKGHLNRNGESISLFLSPFMSNPLFRFKKEMIFRTKIKFVCYFSKWRLKCKRT